MLSLNKKSFLFISLLIVLLTAVSITAQEQSELSEAVGFLRKFRPVKAKNL